MIDRRAPHAGSPLPRLVLAAAMLAWLAVFTHLLVTSNLPRVPLAAQGELSAAGHLLGSLLLALQLCLLMPDARGPVPPVVAGGGIAAGFVLLLELVQELRPTRAFEAGDSAIGLLGCALGVALACLVLAGRVSSQRARLVVALVTVGVAAIGQFTVTAAEAIDRLH